MDGNESKSQRGKFNRGRGRGRGRGSTQMTYGSGRLSTIMGEAPLRNNFLIPTRPSYAGRGSINGKVPRRNDSNEQAEDMQNRPMKGFGFRRLDAMSQLPGLQIMEILACRNTMAEFVLLANQTDLKDAFVVRIVLILGKLSRTEFDTIVVQLLHQISSSSFLNQLLCYIVRLQDEELEESTYKDFFLFFDSLATFCHTVSKLLPTLACEKLNPIVKQSLVFLMTSYFDGIEEVKSKVENVLEKLKVDRLIRKSETVKKTMEEEFSQFSTPPEPFRILPTVPMNNDLLQYRSSFLRPNIVQGAYRDVEHYLDVQFRLLREDFVRPLREGIKEYIFKKRDEATTAGKKRIRVNNVKIYTEVSFEKAEINEDKLGFLICFDVKQKFCSAINWDQSKRFMLGSLLILTVNEFETILLAKVLKRNNDDLRNGRVLIELIDVADDVNVYHKAWLMAESSLFFGAYSHVLEALKRFDELSFPLTEYIVEGKSELQPPPYLLRAVAPLYNLYGPDEVDLDTADDPMTLPDETLLEKEKVHFEVNPLDDEGWPTPLELGLDETQYDAFKSALTQKVMLIQGPPGTGKTYLGLRIASVLLKNHKYWQQSDDSSRPMVVVCYTNHALDQFLAGLMPFTKSIVRVGGGSKDKRLEQFSIQNQRRNSYRPGRNLFSMLREYKEEFSALKGKYNAIRSSKELLQNSCGIVDPECMVHYGVIRQDDLYSFDDRNDFIQWLEEGFPMKAYHQQLGQNLNAPIFECVEENKDLFFIICFSAIDDIKCKAKPQDVISYYEQKKAYLKQYLVSPLTKPELLDLRKVYRLRSLKQLKLVERWQLYRHWVEELLKVLNQSEMELQPKLLKAASNLKQARMVEDQDIMASCRVIGMTTSYAASRQSILKELKPRIVIVEEAAEILEAHVIVSLTGSVEHLIMIGDHLQLRPNPAVFELATKYHLNVSIFERLINNKVRCVSLSTQHRMRPEIAKLVCPAIYPFLLNHESVLKYPSIRGVSVNLAFIDHVHPQEEVEEIQSFRNVHEAKFISAMVRYLCLQGYEPNKITVLATYKGQMFYLNKLRQDNAYLTDVRITVVDNYQGEENDIILLSLVRSNDTGDVGFLKTANRVCVALSRAKQGLFIFGNMQNMVSKGDIWPKIHKVLEDQNCLVKTLELKCEVHGTITGVSSADDFQSVPEGGCLRQCGTLMRCSHICAQVCHTNDREHKEFKCFEPCPRPVCLKNHICPQKCYEICRPCMVLKNVLLPCEHRAEIPCHVDPLEYNCLEVVPCTLVPCNHQRDVLCHQSKNPDKIKCVEQCDVRLECSHSCVKTCHVKDDPDHEEYKCTKPCDEKNYGCKAEHYCRKVCHEDCDLCFVMVEKLLPCDHKWTMKCHEEPSREFCGNKCCRVNVDCGHACKKKCKDECSPCLTLVEKILPRCGHKQKMNCGVDPRDLFQPSCNAKCDRILSCGHPCTKLCHEECLSKCQAMVDFPSKTGCGHTIRVPCHKKSKLDPYSSELLDLCEEPCKVLLQPCNHQCQGTCGKCWQGRLHIACGEACGRVLVCGHSCKAPCAEKCPPCNAPCTVQCKHSRCTRKCGQPCAPCKEPCLRKCPHQKCNRKCGQKCSVMACEVPCEKTLKCKHKCVGLCGDACVCEECNPGIRDVFLGNEDEEDARFIILPDCKQKHIFEVKGLKEWLLQDRGIEDKVCPRCSTPIRKCLRFNEIIMDLAFDVQRVKQRVFGTERDIVSLACKVLRTLPQQNSIPRDLQELISLLQLVSGKLASIEQKRGKWKKAWYCPPLSYTEVFSLLQYSKILSTLVQLATRSFAPHNKHPKLYSSSFKLNDKCRTEVQNFFQKLAKNLRSRNIVRLSDQEAEDMAAVMRGLEILINVCSIESSTCVGGLSSTFKETFQSISKKVRDVRPYLQRDFEHDAKCLASIAAEVKCLVIKAERLSIVAAMGMSKGHWFKCPNGHLYAIGDCGGAAIESKCNECGARIGGGSHRLRADNSFAPEMDGAAAPAWPGTLH